MNLDLAGRVILVTGAGRGIGAAIARAIAEEGAIPVLIDRNTDDASAVAASLPTSLVLQAELGVSEECRHAVEAALRHFGRIDGLVNNAGINDGVSLETGDPERFLLSLRRNLTHYYDMAHFARAELIRNQGAIVNITSKVAETGQGGTSAYAAANGGRNALTREWACELAPYGVRVNAVVVAECWTPMYEHWLATLEDPEKVKQRIESRIPLGQRMTFPEEIASAVVFLLSPLSGHTTGQLLHVDGGYVHLDRALE